MRSNFHDHTVLSIEIIGEITNFGLKLVYISFVISSFCSLELNAVQLIVMCEQSRDQPIPDPIMIVQRLTVIESAMEKLQIDCGDIFQKRKELVLFVTALQIENIFRLKKVRFSALLWTDSTII